MQGYLFDSAGEEPGKESRNDTVCQIIGRADDVDTLSFGPAFVVRFGDNHEMIAYSSELRPWYQTG